MSEAKTKVLVHEGFAELSQEFLSSDGVELRSTDNLADPEIASLILDSEVLVSPQFPKAWKSEETSRLRVVHSTGAGTDWIDRSSLPQGCAICNVYGHERGVTEHVVLLMLALQKHLLQLDTGLRLGDWSPQWPCLTEMRGRSLLILGLGHIGEEVARFAGVFQMEVTVLTRSPSPARSAGLNLNHLGSLTELGEQLPKADFIVVAVPHTPETENLISGAEFANMKSSAYLINVGRAAVVNEEALFLALSTKRIAGAGLDVWYQYPASLSDKRLPSHYPLHELDNVIMTPHKPTVETMEYRWAEIAANIRRFSRGEALQSVVCTINENENN